MQYTKIPAKTAITTIIVAVEVPGADMSTNDASAIVREGHVSSGKRHGSYMTNNEVKWSEVKELCIIVMDIYFNNLINDRDRTTGSQVEITTSTK